MRKIFDEKAKNALIICSYVCALGAFGAFARWLQNQLAFDKVTGVTNPSMWNIIVPLLLIASAVGLNFVIRKYLVNYDAPTKMTDTFRGNVKLLIAAAWVAGGIVALGGLIILLGRNDTQRSAASLIGVLALFSGFSFPAICASAKRNLSPSLVSMFSTLPVLTFVIWLLACYVQNANMPNVWLYGIEIITVSVVITAFYFNAGFAFGKPRPYKALYFSMLGAFMCFVSLADSRAFGRQLVFCGTAAMLLMYCWMIVKNMREKSQEEPEEEKEEEPEETAANEPDAEEPQLIPAGEKHLTNEPTIQVPEKKKDGDEEINSIIAEFKTEE